MVPVSTVALAESDTNQEKEFHCRGRLQGLLLQPGELVEYRTQVCASKEPLIFRVFILGKNQWELY